jgi:predicted YcjX-like family ATPase
MFLLFIITVHADVPKNNIKDLQDVAQYFTAEPWTRCDYNGYLVECSTLAKLKAEEPKHFKQDPGSRMP